MPRRPSDARNCIVQTALALFATRGYHNTGITDILKESAVKRGTLYHYFPSKRELGLAVIDEMARILAEETAVGRLQTPGHPIDRMLRILNDLPGVVKLQSGKALTPSVVVRLGTAEPEFSERLAARLTAFLTEVEAMVHRGVAEGQIKETVDARVLSRVFTVMCEGIFLMSVLGQRQAIWEDARSWLNEHLNSLRT